MATPSPTEVPRPTSSIRTRELSVARPGLLVNINESTGTIEVVPTQYHCSRSHLARKGAEVPLQVIVVRETREQMIVNPVKP